MKIVESANLENNEAAHRVGSDYDGRKLALEKKAHDKMKFYGSLGKRDSENDWEENETEVDSAELEALLHKFKRLDKLKYYGSLGKRSEVDDNEIQGQENDIQKRLDKMRYYGGLGKRLLKAKKSQLDGSQQISNMKKSKIDRLRYMGSLGK